MNLLEALQSYATTTTKRRGNDYALRGRVTIEDAGANWLDAMVRGSEPYLVSIGVDGDQVWTTCTCPLAARGENVCKHVWAAAFVGVQQGLLREIPASASMVTSWDDRGTRTRVPVPSPLELPQSRARDDRPAPSGHRGHPWQTLLAPVLHTPHPEPNRSHERILYTVDRMQTLRFRQGLVVETQRQKRKVNGEWGQPRPIRVSSAKIDELPDRDDREILTRLRGARDDRYTSYGYYRDPEAASLHTLPPILARSLVSRMCASGRCVLRDASNESLTPLRWEDEDGWELAVDFEPRGDGRTEGGDLTIKGSLRRGDERIALEAPHLLLAGGLAFLDGRVLPFDDLGAFGWVRVLRDHGEVHVPEGDADAVVTAILEGPNRPRLSLPPHLRYTAER